MEEEREGVKKTKRKREGVEGEREKEKGRNSVVYFLPEQNYTTYIPSNLLCPLITYNRHPFGMKRKEIIGLTFLSLTT